MILGTDPVLTIPWLLLGVAIALAAVFLVMMSMRKVLTGIRQENVTMSQQMTLMRQTWEVVVDTLVPTLKGIENEVYLHRTSGPLPALAPITDPESQRISRSSSLPVERATEPALSAGDGDDMEVTISMQRVQPEPGGIRARSYLRQDHSPTE